MGTVARIAVTLILLAVPFTASAEQPASSKPQEVRYTVGPNETLGSIALRFKVRLADVRAWNKMTANAVDPGDVLIVRSEPIARPIEKPKPKPVVKKRKKIRYYKVRPGDSFERISKKTGIKMKKLRSYNRGVNPRRLQIGQKIKLGMGYSSPKIKKPKNLPKNRSVSWGRANYGRLYNGMPMETTAGLDIRKTERAWGTKTTVRMLEAAAADVKERWPNAPSLHVGDVSHPNGGYMRPHKSHQSGRDADLSFYHKGNIWLPRFIEMTAETLDAVKNWHFFKTLIDTGHVSYIFVDYRLQKVLYEYAISIGYTPSELAPIIQYLNGRGGRGIIRHSRGHANHFHIRFSCDANDSYCQ